VATIQTGTGLFSGVDIAGTVSKLMQLESRQRDALQTRTNAISTKQAAVSELSGLLLAVQLIGKNLAKDDLYNQRIATSSDPATLAATVTGDAATGTYQFTPLRKAQSEQLLSSGFQSNSDPIGSGTLTLRFGANVQRSASLETLNGGAGVVRGSIRITDRSGAQATIDLSAAQTVDDVLEAINGNTAINVTAVAQGSHIRLIDNTAEGSSHLKVQEVGKGQTAASLGLADVDVDAATANGHDVLRLYAGMNLDALSDGNGVRINSVLPDIGYTLRDGTTGTIDLSPIKPGTSQVDRDTTLGDIIARFNAANPDGKLKLEIAADGQRLKATDLSTDEGHDFTLSSQNDSGALSDLGLNGTPQDGVITGRRIIGGFGTVLLSSLHGGKGLGTLGQVALTDRSGATATVDLADAQTLDDVIGAINDADVSILARVNAAKNGIELVDTSGAQDNHLVVASADATDTAGKDRLNIAVDDNVASVGSGDLHLQVVANNTRLADLNGGAGVAKGTLTIQDTAGKRAVLDLRASDIATAGDVIAAINRLGLQVDAEINDTGDGIRLVDTAHGSAQLTVQEGNSTTAQDLHLNRAAASMEVGGTATQVIDGTTTYTIQIDASDTLADLRQKINDLDAGATATIFSDGSANGFRLAVTSDRSGKAGELVCDTSAAGFSVQETVRAQDALLALGSGAAAAGALVSSSSNTFEDVLPGVSLIVKQTSDQPVTVSVDMSGENATASVKTLVDDYNKFRTRLEDLTAYNADTDQASTLTGDAAALRLDMDLSYLLSGQFSGAGSTESLAQIGISLKDDGTLALDEDKLNAAYAADPQAVKQFFTTKDTGFSAKLDTLIEQLCGEDNSLVSNRINALTDTVQRNQDRIDLMGKLLDAKQQQLYNQFYQMEAAIAKMQSLTSVLDSLQPLTPLTDWYNSSSST